MFVQQEQVLRVLYLEVSSWSSSFTNCWGTFRDRRLSAICSRTCRWFPSVLGNRYILDKVPPNTDGSEGERFRRILNPGVRASPVLSSGT